MAVSCPRGRDCPGSTPFRVQECYLSERRSTIPRLGIMELQKGSRWWEKLLAGAGLGLIEEKSRKLGHSNIYETYECPTCGARVLFMRYLTDEGEVFKRVADSLA